MPKRTVGDVFHVGKEAPSFKPIMSVNKTETIQLIFSPNCTSRSPSHRTRMQDLISIDSNIP